VTRKCFDYKKNNMSPDREKGTGSKRARVTKEDHVIQSTAKGKHYIVHKTSKFN
jgi:hypothetical protein